MFIAESSNLKNSTEGNKKYARDPTWKCCFINLKFTGMLIPKRWKEGGREGDRERDPFIICSFHLSETWIPPLY